MDCSDCLKRTSVARATGVETTISSPSGMPVEISAFRTFSTGRRGRFSISNRHNAGLVTLMVAATFTSDVGETLTTIGGADSWDRDAPFVEGGTRKELPISLAVSVRGGRVQAVDVRPIYAEFADGSRFGPTADDLHGCLASARKRVLAASEKLLAINASGGENATRLALQETPELTWVSFLVKKRGMAAALGELRKRRRLPL
jgi:hypothetical protein